MDEDILVPGVRSAVGREALRPTGAGDQAVHQVVHRVPRRDERRQDVVERRCIVERRIVVTDQPGHVRPGIRPPVWDLVGGQSPLFGDIPDDLEMRRLVRRLKEWRIDGIYTAQCNVESGDTNQGQSGAVDPPNLAEQPWPQHHILSLSSHRLEWHIRASTHHAGQRGADPVPTLNRQFRGWCKGQLLAPSSGRVHGRLYTSARMRRIAVAGS